jgi:hypothetical protein
VHQEIVGAAEVPGEEDAPTRVLDADRGGAQDVSRRTQPEAQRTDLPPRSNDGTSDRGVGIQR